MYGIITDSRVAETDGWLGFSICGVTRLASFGPRFSKTTMLFELVIASKGGGDL
jgi:hypothetical protein